MRMKAILYIALGLSLIVALTTGPSAQAKPKAGQTCGGIGNLQCPAGQACRYPEGQCNTPDLAGTCVRVPDTCPPAGRKVCGCNGTTYANLCELLKAGVREAKKGSCDKRSGTKKH